MGRTEAERVLTAGAVSQVRACYAENSRGSDGPNEFRDDDVVALCDSHEALRRRLALVQAEVRASREAMGELASHTEPLRSARAAVDAGGALEGTTGD